MLEHLKRILAGILGYKDIELIWDTEANLGIDAFDFVSIGPTTSYDELTVMHKANQPGTLSIMMGSGQNEGINLLYVDIIEYAANEVISKVYNITGRYSTVKCLNGATAQTQRMTFVMMRKA